MPLYTYMRAQPHTLNLFWVTKRSLRFSVYDSCSDYKNTCHLGNLTIWKLGMNYGIRELAQFPNTATVSKV